MNLFSILYNLMCASHIIKNSNYPSCKSCAHFLYYIDEMGRGSYEFSKCSRFGTQHVVSGEIKYDFAELCRNNQNKCNLTGNYYTAKIE